MIGSACSAPVVEASARIAWRCFVIYGNEFYDRARPVKLHQFRKNIKVLELGHDRGDLVQRVADRRRSRSADPPRDSRETCARHKLNIRSLRSKVGHAVLGVLSRSYGSSQPPCDRT